MLASDLSSITEKTYRAYKFFHRLVGKAQAGALKDANSLFVYIPLEIRPAVCELLKDYGYKVSPTNDYFHVEWAVGTAVYGGGPFTINELHLDEPYPQYIKL